MNAALVNWKTSLLGLSIILTTLGTISHDLAGGATLAQEITGPNLGLLFSGVVGLFAKDAAASAK
ncbi:MAG: hypothetical protein WB816_05625 [Methylocystis sp.]